MYLLDRWLHRTFAQIFRVLVFVKFALFDVHDFAGLNFTDGDFFLFRRCRCAVFQVAAVLFFVEIIFVDGDDFLRG
jgi:hypothetical protein